MPELTYTLKYVFFTAHVHVLVVCYDKNRLTLALWMARPWHAVSPPICWTQLLRPLKSQNTTSDRRPPSIETTNLSCPINGHNLWDSANLYGTSQYAQRPSARLTSLITWTYTHMRTHTLTGRNTQMEHYEGIFKLKMLFHHEGKEECIQSFCNGSSEQHWGFRKKWTQKHALFTVPASLLLFGRLDFSLPFLFMTSCRQWADSQ